MTKKEQRSELHRLNGLEVRVLPKRMDIDEIYEANKRMGLGDVYVKFKKTGKV